MRDGVDEDVLRGLGPARQRIRSQDSGSLLLTHDPNGTVRGLKEWPPDQWPPVAITFFAFRIMVGIGFLMLAIIAVSWWLRVRRRLFEAGWFLRGCETAAPLGFLAVLAGWTTTEVGRQPWTVYGLMRTADSASPSLTGSDVLISLIGYGVVYLVMFPAGVALMGQARGVYAFGAHLRWTWAVALGFVASVATQQLMENIIHVWG